MTIKTAAQLKSDFQQTDPTDQNANLADSALAAASTSQVGQVTLASSANAVTGTDTAKAVTPAALRAVMGKRKLLTALGKNGSGAVTLTGAVVGDIVENVAGITAGSLGNAAASFESVITVVNQIQQSSASDLSAKAYAFDLLAVA